MPITRRRLIAASGATLAAGGAAATLTACGGDGRTEPSAERDIELLQRALDAQASVSDLYRVARRQALDPPVVNAIETFDRRSSRNQRQLALRIEDAGGTPAEPDIRTPAAESVVEAIGIALDDAIAAEHGIVGHLSSPAARRTVYEAMTSDAAQLAAFRGILGEVQVPAAFVTGDSQPHLGTEGEGEAGEPEGEG
jgi:hypothetical protein